MRFNNTSGQTRFRFYKTSTYTGDSYKAISLYKLTEANTALGYATEFKKTLTTPCADSSSNNQAKVEAVWSELSARFTRLRASVQTELKNGTSTEATVLEALELYDHIVRRYGNEIINDFMARGITHNASNITYKTSNSNTTILVVILVTFASVTAVGGYFFLRKRKTY